VWPFKLNVLSQTLHWVANRPPVQVLLLGLEGSGKTTLLYKLKLGAAVSTTPTVGYNLETIRYKGFELVVWDVGGQPKMRTMWQSCYNGTDVVIWVVDSSNHHASVMDDVQMEFARMLSHTEMDSRRKGELHAHMTLLVVANKQDVPGARTAAEVADALELKRLVTHRWHVQPTSAKTGVGLYEGLDWLSATLHS
jgi:small GTP-binding protein